MNRKDSATDDSLPVYLFRLPAGSRLQVRTQGGEWRDIDPDSTDYEFRVRVIEPEAPPEPEPEPEPPVRVIANGQDGYKETGVWALSARPGYLGSSRFSRETGPPSTAVWRFDVAPGRSYRVSIRWSEGPQRATNAPYSVLDGGEPLDTFRVNQRDAPTGFRDERGAWWYDLGAFIPRSGELRIKLSNQADGNVSADAVRVELLSDSDEPKPDESDEPDPDDGSDDDESEPADEPDDDEPDPTPPPPGLPPNLEHWA